MLYRLDDDEGLTFLRETIADARWMLANEHSTLSMGRLAQKCYRVEDLLREARLRMGADEPLWASVNEALDFGWPILTHDDESRESRAFLAELLDRVEHEIDCRRRALLATCP